MLLQSYKKIKQTNGKILCKIYLWTKGTKGHMPFLPFLSNLQAHTWSRYKNGWFLYPNMWIWAPHLKSSKTHLRLQSWPRNVSTCLCDVGPQVMEDSHSCQEHLCLTTKLCDLLVTWQPKAVAQISFFHHRDVSRHGTALESLTNIFASLWILKHHSSPWVAQRTENPTLQEREEQNCTMKCTEMSAIILRKFGCQH